MRGAESQQDTLASHSGSKQSESHDTKSPTTESNHRVQSQSPTTESKVLDEVLEEFQELCCRSKESEKLLADEPETNNRFIDYFSQTVLKAETLNFSGSGSG